MSEFRMKAFIGHYISKLKTLLWSRNVLSFLIFLSLSFLFWFINMLDKERQVTLNIPIRYNEMPNELDITQATSSVIRVVVKDKGVNLLTYTDNNLKPVSIDLRRSFNTRGKFVIANDILRNKVAGLLLPTTSILEIKPDSLVLVYEKLTSKMLPVVIDGRIETAQQYILSSKVQTEPDSVKVFGPAKVLKDLTELKTEKITLTEINKDLSVAVKLAKLHGLRYSTDDVKLNLHAEMFTEKELMFPVTVINCPAEINIRPFPSQIRLKFNVGLSHFKTVSVNDIRILLDYKIVEANNTGKQRIQIVNNVSYISNIRPEIEEIEYVIERR